MQKLVSAEDGKKYQTNIEFFEYITTSSQNEKQIHEVAKAINTAEETALQKIKKVCNPKQEQHNAVEDSSVVRDNQ